MAHVFLVIPPDYDHYFPPLGTPVLAAYLKERGHAVRQWDMNISYRDFLASRILAPALTRSEKNALVPSVKKSFFAERLKDRYYAPLLKIPDRAGLPYLPYDNLSNSSFHFTERLLSSPFLGRYLSDDGNNTFLQSYRWCGFLEEIKKEKPSFLGISVTSPSQAIAALTLGLWTKSHYPKVRVILGGQWVSLYRGALARDRRLARCFDKLVFFEGETPLGRFVAGSRVAAGSRREEDLDTLPCPDFDGLPLSDYIGIASASRALPYETSRGCYWSRCAYCVDLPLPRPSYRRRDPRRVVRDLKRLQKRYGADYFMLSDPGLSPRQMGEISGEILKQRFKTRWWCMARLDPGFTGGLFRRAAAAGLEQINFGFESASDRVCARLHKGNLAQRSEKIIRACKEAGIKVGMQTILGLPGETEEEAWETVAFLLRNKKYIDESIFNIYYLTPSCEVYLHPERYGIRFRPDSRYPFRFFHPFKNVEGMTQEKAFGFEKIHRMLFDKENESKTAMPAAPRGRLHFSLSGEALSMDYW